MPLGQVTRTTGQGGQPRIESSQERSRGEHPDPRPGQLQGERQALEPLADGDHVLDIGGGELEVGAYCSGGGDEDGDRRRLRDLREGMVGYGVRNGQAKANASGKGERQRKPSRATGLGRQTSRRARWCHCVDNNSTWMTIISCE